MRKWNDERFDRLLTNYCEAAPERSFVYDPDCKKDKPLFFVHYRRIAAAAASIVFVSLLSVFLFFQFGNKIDAPLAVVPPSHSELTPSSQETENDSDAADRRDGALPSDSAAPSNAGSGGTAGDSTEPHGGSSSAYAPQPTTPRSPNATTAASADPITPKSTEKSQTGGDPAVDPTIEPIVPGEDPTQTVDDPEPTVPCDPPSNDDPVYPGAPDETTGGNSGDPSDPDLSIVWVPAPTGTSAQGEFICTFTNFRMLEDHLVFCRIYEDYEVYGNYGKPIGSSDWFDASHKARIISQDDDYTTVSYVPPDGLIVEGGCYHVIFYNSRSQKLGRYFLDL